MDKADRHGSLDLARVDPAVADLYLAWQGCEQRLDEHKARFRAAVADFVADPRNPDPIRLLSQLLEMREDCNRVCRELVWALKNAAGEDDTPAS